MLTKPHALYYDGKLIAVILNPEPYGTASQIADNLSPDQGAAEVVPIPQNMGNMRTWSEICIALIQLGVKETLS